MFDRVDRSFNMSNSMGVSRKFICTLINPERFNFRRPATYPIKTALISSTQEL